MSNVHNGRTLTQYIITETENDPVTKLVLVALSTYVRRDWTTSVAISHIGKIAGVSRNTVRRALKRLEDEGVIVTVKAGLQNKSTTYRIIEPVGFSSWKTKMNIPEGQMTTARGSNDDAQRVHGEPLNKELNIYKTESAQNASVEKPLTGIARRDALRAARLIQQGRFIN